MLLELQVPRRDVKAVKTALEKSTSVTGKPSINSRPGEEVLRIFVDLLWKDEASQDEQSGNPSLLGRLGLVEFEDIMVVTNVDAANSFLEETKGSPFQSAIRKWLEACGMAQVLQNRDEVEALSANLSKSYTLYGPMLLLHARVHQIQAWQDALSQRNDGRVQHLYELIAEHVKVTHIATTAPIPLYNTVTTSDSNTSGENILRSPSNFQPLQGDFGPTTSSSPPTVHDFDAAFWVTAKQNGVLQTWAPRWTMFSRGNVGEKARILALPSVAAVVQQGKDDGRGCATVDLYAGIGYFAFSYVKAGVDKVLCWDLNPWSTEGLRRGARANKWETMCYAEGEMELNDMTRGDARLLVFNEANDRALSRIEKMRRCLPPVRHVNCGLLPTSRGSWATAVAVLDQGLGGWVHVHENFATLEIESKAEEVRTAFQDLLGGNEHGAGGERKISVEHVQRVKSYAPGVMHCVVDIYVPPRSA